jgi:flagellar protein FlaG
MDISAIQGFSSSQVDAAYDATAREALIRTAPQAADAQSNPVDMDVVLQELQQVSQAFNRRLSFSYNEKLGEVIVKVIDTQTDKIIKEIPPAEIQRVHERIREVIGILFDERA